VQAKIEGMPADMEVAGRTMIVCISCSELLRS
jgi:hypothetical protein